MLERHGGSDIRVLSGRGVGGEGWQGRECRGLLQFSIPLFILSAPPSTCHSQAGRALPSQLNLLEAPSQTHSEVYLLGDSKSSQVDKESEPPQQATVFTGTDMF